MNKLSSFLVVLTAFLLVSCTTEIAKAPGIPAPSVTARAASANTPAFFPSPTPSPAPTSLPAGTALSTAEGPPAAAVLVEHTVQPGDTLLGLAIEYDVPMAAIQLQNGLGDSTIVQVGQVLEIPPRTGWEGASRFWIVHVVRAGETVVGIAQSYGLQVADVEAVNGLTDADLIVVGEELILPLDAPTVARAPEPTETPVPPPIPTTTVVDVPTALPVVPPPADVADWPHETVRIINEVRAQYSLSPLAYNETLALAAQAQASDCSQRGWCSHVGSDSADIKARIVRAGYNPANWAECWAQHQTPQGAVDIWMDETPPNDPHRRTLLTTGLSEIGVGVAPAGHGSYYFIADFGRPRP